MAWHDKEKARTIKGQDAELLFDRTWECRCGGVFIKNDAVIHYQPDRRCKSCGQLIDIKHIGYTFDAFPVSQVPFDKYPPGLIITVWTGGYWLGSTRKDCRIKSGPHLPAHKERGTSFYLILLDNFRLLEFFLHRKSEAGTLPSGLETK